MDGSHDRTRNPFPGLGGSQVFPFHKIKEDLTELSSDSSLKKVLMTVLASNSKEIQRTEWSGSAITKLLAFLSTYVYKEGFSALTSQMKTKNVVDIEPCHILEKSNSHPLARDLVREKKKSTALRGFSNKIMYFLF